MSEQSVACRKAAKEKVSRLTNQTVGKVDASDWSPGSTFGQEQTYPQPPARRKFADGGSVDGDRVKRALGGFSSMNPSDPRNTATAMMQKAGNIAGVGGSRMQFGPIAKAGLSPMRAVNKSGGKVVDDDRDVDDKVVKAGQRGLKSGGRTCRKSGGRAKGKTNINIVIAQPPAQQPGSDAAPGMMPKPPIIPQPGPMGPPLPSPGPVGGPPPALGGPPGIPMPRKRGGRTMHAGAGSGEGRLEKTEYMKRGED